jgi:CspA family cold shock protein
LSLLAKEAPPVVAVAPEGQLNMTIGTVKFFNENKGYGFIAPEGGGSDAFVHISAVEASGMRTLRENQRVSYELQEDRRGKMAAVNLKSADDSAADSESQADSDDDQGAE